MTAVPLKDGQPLSLVVSVGWNMCWEFGERGGQIHKKHSFLLETDTYCKLCRCFHWSFNLKFQNFIKNYAFFLSPVIFPCSIPASGCWEKYTMVALILTVFIDPRRISIKI